MGPHVTPDRTYAVTAALLLECFLLLLECVGLLLVRLRLDLVCVGLDLLLALGLLRLTLGLQLVVVRQIAELLLGDTLDAFADTVTRDGRGVSDRTKSRYGSY